MPDVEDQELKVGSEADIVSARRMVRNSATGMGFGITDVTRIVTAASELVRNIYQYAGSGTMRCRSMVKDGRAGIILTFDDSGPGIADLGKALEMGYSTSGGLGMGLPGAKRLMDEMEIHSTPGRGTTVEIRKWLKA